MENEGKIRTPRRTPKTRPNAQPEVGLQSRDDVGEGVTAATPSQEQPVAMTAEVIQQMIADAVQVAVANVTEERLSRTQEQREAEPIHEAYGDMWEEPLTLDTRNIPARPGYHQRWMRTLLEGKEDVQNIAKRYNQGYRPRQASTIPKGVTAATVKFQEFGEVIGIRGMVLVEIPIEKYHQQQRYIRHQAKQQMRAVDEDLMKDGAGDIRKTHTSKITRGVPRIMSD